jgi:hypothetical protein
MNVLSNPAMSLSVSAAAAIASGDKGRAATEPQINGKASLDAAVSGALPSNLIVAIAFA